MSRKRTKISPEARRAQKQVYYQRNKEKIKVQTSEYRKRNWESRKARIFEVTRIYQAKNKDRIALLAKARYQNSKERSYLNHIKNEYGLSEGDYLELLYKCDNRCRICRSLPNPDSKYKRLVVDHNHNTGRVRGLLCSKCNLALGNVRDSTEILSSCVQYLSLKLSNNLLMTISPSKSGLQTWRNKNPHLFQELIAKYNGCCWICRNKSKLLVDHHHASGIVRGVLCSGCNTAIGMMNEDVTLIGSAINYLHDHGDTDAKTSNPLQEKQ
jgi:hypothetical protein